MPKTLTHQVGILMLGRVFAYAVMFFTPMVNVRALSVEEYGYYRQFWLIIETLTPMLVLGFARSLQYYLPRADSHRDKSIYLTQTVLFLGIASLIGWGVYTVMGHGLGEGLGAMTRAFYWRLVLFTSFIVVSQYMETLFVAERQVTRQAVYHSSTAALQAIVVMSVAWFTRDVNIVIWALAIFAMIKFLFAMGYTFTVYPPVPRLISLRSMREQLSFAFPLGLMAVATILVAQTDKFVINRFLGREAFAIYSIGAFQIPFVAIIRGSVTNIIFPMMAQYEKEGNHAEIVKLWKRTIVKTAVLFYPLFIFFAVSATPFITILFTEAYAPAAPVFLVYLFLFLRSSIETANIIQVYKKMNYLVKVMAVAVVFNLGLSLLFFWAFGRIGVAVATVVTMNAVNIINLFYASRLVNASVLDLFPVWTLIKRLIVAAVPGIPLWFAYRYLQIDNVIELGLAAGAYFVTYFAFCSSVGYIGLDDVKAIIGRKK